MANKNDVVVLAYYHNEDAAEFAAQELKKWDKANKDIKLGAIAIVTLDPKSGNIEANEVGQRKTKKGALWGTSLGAVAGLMTGGLALIPAMLLGATGGGAVGAMFHKKIGMTDEDREHLAAQLRSGSVAVVVTADDFEVESTQAELARTGGTVSSYVIPEETQAEISEAIEAQEEAGAAVDEAVGAVPEDTAATEATLAVEMPGLTPEGAAAVAMIIAATELSAEDAVKLQEAGINKPSDLLVRAATRHGRKELVGLAGVNNHEILEGVKRMDLMRIEGVGVRHSALLLAAGVDTLPELAQRNPTNLHATLETVNAEKQLVANVPTEGEVADWVAGAKAARRVIEY